MNWIELSFEVPSADVERLEGLLETQGASAITLRDNSDQPLLEPAPGSMPIWPAVRVTGLFPGSVDAAALLLPIAAGFAPGALPPHEIAPLADQPWDRAWMDRFTPMRFGRRLWIVPTWHRPPDPTAVNLRLDPGRAFGTGTHATTALCLEWLDGARVKARRVLDYGCGSGVLAIAAAALGAGSVHAVDLDPQAVAVTGENVACNGLEDRIDAIAPVDLAPGEFDVIVGNILAGPLIHLADFLGPRLAEDGDMVLSGILEAQAEAVIQAYRPWCTLDPRRVREGWVLLHGRGRKRMS